ncbi:hypothetical protein FEM48_Zijuj11G0140400 [Ziziphus jujuba var. spinosa]|uniref:NB-ARC domain-containing protein n=1 Tax=Ziziphus jujuba var. spinosa TaxID=714518 RepID=A0A978UJD0_ZIZJJ|nr:hypothetical protein FEM48_Zijuj11G0140400 [Ziziphus jujuba var. spinosa]
MRKINSEINEVTKRLEDISIRENKLGLNKIERSLPEWKRPPSSSLPDTPVVVGRDEDKEKIVELLLRENQNKENFDVVGLVGMPGVGKTTLARLAFKDDAMKHFDIKVWVSVSDDFDYVRLTKAILNSIDSESKSFDEFSQIQNHLSKDLAGKKFLIVMDDVWNKKFLQLQKLVVKRCPMLKGKLPKILPSLKDLEVVRCQQLTVSIPSSQLLCSLIIRYCAEVVCENHAHLKSLKSIEVSGSPKFWSNTTPFGLLQNKSYRYNRNCQTSFKKVWIERQDGRFRSGSPIISFLDLEKPSKLALIAKPLTLLWHSPGVPNCFCFKMCQKRSSIHENERTRNQIFSLSVKVGELETARCRD